MPKFLSLLLISILLCTAQMRGQSMLPVMKGRQQNLVTNPGFEEKNRCPTDRGQINGLVNYTDFTSVTDWISPLNTTPDYFNTCGTAATVRLPHTAYDGYHHAHSGSGCAGISMFSGIPEKTSLDYWAEYLQTRLSAPLIVGHNYYVSYYVCLTHHIPYLYNLVSVDNIGARLTNKLLDTACVPPMFFVSGQPDIQTPPGVFITDTVNWTLVSGRYVANGGEQWLTLGRFYSEVVNYKPLFSPLPPGQSEHLASTCYMLVDDVCVIDMDNPVALDTDIYTPQFPVAIGQGRAQGKYEWENGDTSLQMVVNGPGVYERRRLSECGYYIDRFNVAEAVIDYCVWLPTAFTPNDDGKNDVFGPGNSYCSSELTDYSFKIYNRFGQEVFVSEHPGEKWDGKFNGVAQELGVYYYTLRYMLRDNFNSQNSTPGTPKLVNGDVTLLR